MLYFRKSAIFFLILLLLSLSFNGGAQLRGPEIGEEIEGEIKNSQEGNESSQREIEITYGDEYVGEPFYVDLSGENTSEGHPGFYVGEIEVVVSGAGGGGGEYSSGGDGGYLEATLDVREFDELEISVGEGGKTGDDQSEGGEGGWGKFDGGAGGDYAGGGGGSTEIWADVDAGGVFLTAADAGGGGRDQWAHRGSGGGGARGGEGGTSGTDGEDGEGVGFGGDGGPADDNDGGPGGQEVNHTYLIGDAIKETGGGSEGNYEEDGSKGSIIITYHEVQTDVQTHLAREVSPTSATLQGYLTLSENESANVSFSYRKVGGPWIHTEISSKDQIGGFEEVISDLEPLTRYEFKAVGVVNETEYEGERLSFVTGDLSRTTQLKDEWIDHERIENLTTDDHDLVLADGAYEGTRISDPMPLDDLERACDSVIIWNNTEPLGTNITVYTAVTESNASLPTDWSESTNGEDIQDIERGGDLSEMYLWTRQILSTNDTESTPRLHELSEAMILTSPDHIRISPEDSILTAGDTEEYAAAAYDEFDNEIQDVTEDVDWTIEDGAGGGWEENLYTSETAGTWTVTGIYIYDGKELQGNATLVVEPADVDHVVIVPEEDQEIPAGETIDFDAEAYDGYENLITSEDRDFEWKNASESGLFDESEVGVYEVEASYDEIRSETISVTVVAGEVDSVVVSPQEDQTIEAGETIDFDAEAYDGYENLITSEAEDFTWENATEEGGFEKTDAGEHVVTAAYEGLRSQAITVTIEPGRAERVELDPSEDRTIEIGETIHFSASAYDRYENLVTDSSEEFEWEGAEDDGLFNETEAGEYEVRASYGDITSSSVLVTIEPAEAEYIEISPSESTVTAGEEQKYTGAGYDDLDNEFELTGMISWSIDESAGGRWEENVYISEFSGDWTVIGTYSQDGEELTSEATLTVEAAEAARLEIEASAKEVSSGENATFEATAFDEYGNVIGDVTEGTEWSIDEEAEGTWDGNVYVAENRGEWNVTGTYEGISATGSLIVEEEDDGLTIWGGFWWLPLVIVFVILVVVWKRRKGDEDVPVETNEGISPSSKITRKSREIGPLDLIEEEKKTEEIKEKNNVDETDIKEDEELIELEKDIVKLLEEDDLDKNLEEKPEKEEVSERSKEEEPDEGIICPGCGSKISEDTEICYRCGKDLKMADRDEEGKGDEKR